MRLSFVFAWVILQAEASIVQRGKKNVSIFMLLFQYTDKPERELKLRNVELSYSDSERNGSFKNYVVDTERWVKIQTPTDSGSKSNIVRFYTKTVKNIFSAAVRSQPENGQSIEFNTLVNVKSKVKWRNVF